MKLEEDYSIYRGRLKDPSLKVLNWYEDNIIKTFSTEDNFILKIKTGDEHLIEILKSKNDLEFLEKDIQYERNSI